MNVKIEFYNGASVATVDSVEPIIKTVGDALDLMADCDYRGARMIILKEENFTPEFFDLKSGLAGGVLQKFVQYGVRFAVVGDFGKYESKSLRDFIYESNRTGVAYFASSYDEAVAGLTGKNR